MPDQLADLLRERLADVNEWLRFAEAKNGGLAAAALGAASAGAALLMTDGEIPLALRWYLLVGVPVMLFAASFALASFAPQLRKEWPYGTGTREEDDNILFFRDAAKYTPAALVSAVQRLASLPAGEPSDLAVLLAGQVINNARIADRKFRSFEVGIWLAIAALITPPFAIALYVFEKGRRRERST